MTAPSAPSEYTAEMAHAAVQRGAAWLDERCPTWVSEIDLEVLRLVDADACMLGQTASCVLNKPVDSHANYFTVLESISLDGDEQDAWAEEHGFKAPLMWGWCGTTHYEMLTIAWREYIRERLAVPQ